MLSRNGVKVTRLSTPVGMCDTNELASTSESVLSPSFRRLVSELSIKKQPFKQRVVFCRRNGGFFWLAWVFVPYVRSFLFGKR